MHIRFITAIPIVQNWNTHFLERILTPRVKLACGATYIYTFQRTQFDPFSVPNEYFPIVRIEVWGKVSVNLLPTSLFCESSIRQPIPDIRFFESRIFESHTDCAKR